MNTSFKQRRIESSCCKGLQKVVRKKIGALSKKHEGKLNLVVADERTTMSQQQSHQVDLSLKEAMVDERKFGRCAVVMLGDLAQLPPVMATSLWIDVRTGDDLAGWNPRAELTTVVKLTENNRLDTNDLDAVAFDAFLDRLRDGENTKVDHNILREKCSMFAMGVKA